MLSTGKFPFQVRTPCCLKYTWQVEGFWRAHDWDEDDIDWVGELGELQAILEPDGCDLVNHGMDKPREVIRNGTFAAFARLFTVPHTRILNWERFGDMYEQTDNVKRSPHL